MKRLVGILIIVLMVAGSCGPKPTYRTKEGKKKLKKYNALQFGDPRAK